MPGAVDVGAKLLELMTLAGVSGWSDLCARANLERATVWQLRRGRLARTRTVEALAGALGVTVAVLSFIPVAPPPPGNPGPRRRAGRRKLSEADAAALDRELSVARGEP